MVSSTNTQSMDDVLEHDLEKTLTLDQLVATYKDDNSNDGYTEVDNTDINQNDDNGSNSRINIVTEISDPNENIQLAFLTETDDPGDSAKNTDNLR